MYQKSNNQLKRVDGNSNLNLHSEPYYKGFPVQVSHGDLISEQLESMRQLILEQTAFYDEVFAIRLDLTFPSNYWPLEGQTFSNEYFDRFKRHLKKSLDRMSINQYHGLKLIAAREYGAESGKPHFHVVVLLNGDAISKLGTLDLSKDNLYTRLHEAWASALGVTSYECKGLIELSKGSNYKGNERVQAKNGCFWFSRAQKLVLEDFFFACSYMAKVATKIFYDGYHSFLCSRTEFDDWW